MSTTMFSSRAAVLAHSSPIFNYAAFSRIPWKRTFTQSVRVLAPVGLKVNQTRLWDAIHHTAQWSTSTAGGVKRLTLTDEDKSVREWFRKTTQDYGCTVTVDAMGNMFAVRSGKSNTVAPIGIGSHLDTQPAGGCYDGILGVQAGVEILKVLQENKIETFAPIAVINWTNEEGARFNTGMLGSGVWAGVVDLQKAYDHQDADGKFFKDELQRIGFLGDTEASHKANPLSAHFELHIEQGPVLEDTKQSVGVVNGVQGMGWLMVTVQGSSQHCGTTPMERRADALLAASKMIIRVNEIAYQFGGLATVGVINSEPQSPGTVPGKTVFSVDLCHLDNPTMDKMFQTAQDDFKQIAKKSNVEVDAVQIWRSAGVKFHPDCIDCVRSAAIASVGDKHVELPAGAGHDSVNTSYHCPTSMVFIPSKNGLSHHPDEYSSPEDCALGAQVMLDSVLRYDDKMRNSAL
ncbi:hypothetical protein BP6252_10841 [Coleophoma cylindrospora]|uniref:N-carbamoyl-L-amino acid hydrolase n=1 Tax=Coleophoma cylindrospora TaxID=1849047 RepID=A0A3D8QN98_9HELO|nr:hypothetical protein BP6252_10841 [Coleophoma cylindrospora]